MKSKTIQTDKDTRSFVVVMESGEEAFGTLTTFARDAGIAGASISAIGAFERAELGWFDLEGKTYRKIPVEAQSEALSLIGDIAQGDDGGPSLHLHAVLGLRDGTTRGGHFLSGKVRPTLEVTVTELPAHLRRRKRPELGIALIDL
jgi:predicted DNA-binding protein with PD1-like motif